MHSCSARNTDVRAISAQPISNGGDSLALEAPDAIRKWRALMGATDPAKAEPGALRKEFGASIENNATHGSDAPETAAFELAYFFPGIELAR